MVLGGSCNGNKGGAVSGAGEDTAVNEGIDKSSSPELNKARWDAWAFLFGSKHLSYLYFLNKEKPLEGRTFQLYTKSKGTSDKHVEICLTNRFKELQDYFPISGSTEHVANALKGFDSIKLSKKEYIKFYTNYGKVIEEIASVYSTFYSLVQELNSTYKHIQKGGYDIDFNWKTKEKELDDFYERHIKNKFNFDTAISISKDGEKNASLLYEDTKQLLPFLASPATKEIMENEVGRVMSCVNDAETLIEGVSLQRDISGGKLALSKRSYTFDIGQRQAKDFKGSKEMTFKELLFLICKGTLEDKDKAKAKAKVTGGIFGVLNNASSNKKDKLKSDPNAFKKLVTEAKSDKFADYIVELINNSGNKIWGLLNIDTVKAKLRTLLGTYSGQAPFLKDASKLWEGADSSNLQEIDHKNFTTALLMYMVEPFNDITLNGKSVDDVLTAIIAKKNTAESSGESGKLISYRLAEEIKKNQILLDELKNEAEPIKLNSAVEGLTDILGGGEMQKNMFCVLVDGRTQLTALGAKFKEQVCELETALIAAKRVCTYADVNNQIGFNIEPIHDWAEETYHLLKAFLVLPDKLSNVFYNHQEMSQSVDYATKIEIQNADLGLEEDMVIEKLDDFRLDYLKSKKKTENPEAPAAPAA
ncbi:MAG: hypothetical protein NQ127_01710 [Candidatus Cardinium sp.]|nr:hypothetical protein [Candidatus Cardinium sp.]